MDVDSKSDLPRVFNRSTQHHIKRELQMGSQSALACQQQLGSLVGKVAAECTSRSTFSSLPILCQREEIALLPRRRC